MDLGQRVSVRAAKSSTPASTYLALELHLFLIGVGSIPLGQTGLALAVLDEDE
jgi:hypothetical protein